MPGAGASLGIGAVSAEEEGEEGEEGLLLPRGKDRAKDQRQAPGTGASQEVRCKDRTKTGQKRSAALARSSH